MTIPSTPAPPHGTVTTAQLLADAQGRTLWLGVPDTVDPSGSVLICDLIGLQQADTATLNSAKSYADTGLSGKANTTHTHAIADVTGLTAALASLSGSLPTGCICLWSGTIITIPAGWQICDGTNGTPDLRDRFVMGSGGTNPQRTPGGSQNRNLTTAVAGGHSHGGATGQTTLTVGQLPAHAHPITITDPGHTHVVDDPGHVHTSAASVRLPSSGNNFNTPFVGGAGTMSTNSAVTGIVLENALTGITGAGTNIGGDQGHSHPIPADGGHSHTIPQFDVLPPFYTLAYIQKMT